MRGLQEPLPNSYATTLAVAWCKYILKMLCRCVPLPGKNKKAIEKPVFKVLKGKIVLAKKGIEPLLNSKISYQVPGFLPNGSFLN